MYYTEYEKRNTQGGKHENTIRDRTLFTGNILSPLFKV